MNTSWTFAEADMEIDEGLGYPRAYAKLCRNPNLFNPYNQGPPNAYTPYALHPQEALRARELDQYFPVIDVNRKPSTNPSNYVSLLWKQLNHLGRAGFDPAKFRVDLYGNVIFFHADSGSPLAWEVDHWFPCSRGGRTVSSNLRLVQWQAYKRKQDNMEFLIPWWDLQLGISVNQFLSIFASASLDFRNRAFRWLFSDGENEDVNDSQAAESHIFPQHFTESERKIGLAPAALVMVRRDLDAPVLQSLDSNRSMRSSSPMTGRKADKQCKASIPLKENIQPDMSNNQHFIIAKARDSLVHREEMASLHLEMQKQDDELASLKQKNDAERVALQELESLLIKKRRRAEKCRRLAESQSSYRALLEKMIGDAMHQSVTYKQQIRLNQAANSALMARLEAQKAICDASEKEVCKKFKQREEIENQMRPFSNQARKRSRIDDVALEDICNRTNRLSLGRSSTKKVIHKKELRLFLEDEQKVSEAKGDLDEQKKPNKCEEDKGELQKASEAKGGLDEHKEPNKCEEDKGELHIKTEDSSWSIPEDESALDDELKKLAVGEEKCCKKTSGKASKSPTLNCKLDDEEYRRKVGKGTVERWLQMLLENAQNEDSLTTSPTNVQKIEQMPNEEVEDIEKINIQKKGLEEPNGVEENKKFLEIKRLSEVGIASKGLGSKSFERKERGITRCESARSLRTFPPSPSLILGIRKGVDCIKKPMVIGDDEVGEASQTNTKSSTKKSLTKVIKNAIKHYDVTSKDGFLH